MKLEIPLNNRTLAGKSSRILLCIKAAALVKSFNRSVALNAFTTLIDGRMFLSSGNASIAQSRSMPLPLRRACAHL